MPWISVLGGVPRMGGWVGGDVPWLGLWGAGEQGRCALFGWADRGVPWVGRRGLFDQPPAALMAPSPDVKAASGLVNCKLDALPS